MLKKRLVSELDKYEELLSEKMRLEFKAAEIQKETGTKITYTANELAVMNSSSLLAKYEENAKKFKVVLDNVCSTEAQITSFWDDADKLLDEVSEFELFKDAVNPSYSEELQEIDEKLIEEVERTFRYLSARDISNLN